MDKLHKSKAVMKFIGEMRKRGRRHRHIFDNSMLEKAVLHAKRLGKLHIRNKVK